MAVDYSDPSHITTVGDLPTVAQWIRTKMYGADVREALAQAVELVKQSIDKNEGYITTFQNDIKAAQDATAKAENDATNAAGLITGAQASADKIVDAGNAAAKTATDAGNSLNTQVTAYLQEIKENGGVSADITDPPTKAAVTAIAAS